jgi:hypothetical protein
MEIGFDVDDDEPQLCHACWPYESERGALCGSKRLWFQYEGSRDQITCPECLRLLENQPCPDK